MVQFLFLLVYMAPVILVVAGVALIPIPIRALRIVLLIAYFIVVTRQMQSASGSWELRLTVLGPGLLICCVRLVREAMKIHSEHKPRNTPGGA